MTEEQAREFENELEMNLSHLDRAVGNFRINIFRQRGTISLVIRYVRSDIPSFEQLKLPPVLLDLVMEKRGLVLIAGATGSGKSTTLAAMIDYRNTHRTGHILTLEDPIEYLFEHKKSIVNQREISIDTLTYTKALAERAARGARPHHDRRGPRPRDDAAGAAAHADRPPVPRHAAREQQLPRAVADHQHVSVRRALGPAVRPLDRPARDRFAAAGAQQGRRAQPAVEILLNSSLIAELIKNGEITQIKEAMENRSIRDRRPSSRRCAGSTSTSAISYDEAMTASDSSTNLAWLINQNAPTARVDDGARRGGCEAAADCTATSPNCRSSRRCWTGRTSRHSGREDRA